jgi:hypothetical protein
MFLLCVENRVPGTRSSTCSHPSWSDFDAQDVHAVERVINIKYPKNSPFPHDKVLVTKFWKLVDCC